MSQLDNNVYYVIEGTVANFESATGKIDLLKQIQGSNDAANIATGIAGVVGDMYGMVANSAMLAMYEGEDVDHFAFTLDDRIICGALPDVRLLKNGDAIRAVVRKEKGLLFADAIQRPSDTLMWMTGPVFTGKDRLFSQEMRNGYIAFAILLACIPLHLLYITFVRQEELYSRDILGAFIVVGLVTSGIFGVNYWIYKDIRPFAERAEKIFRALDFPDPGKFDLMLGFAGRAFNYAKAVRKYTDKKNGVKPPKRRKKPTRK